jgi:hypothetical protein
VYPYAVIAFAEGMPVTVTSNSWVSTSSSSASSTLFSLIRARASAVPNDTTADFVLGQPNMVSAGYGLSASSLFAPSGVAVDSNNNVYVADSLNNRVLEYDDPLNTDAIADRVFGQG